MLKLLFNTDLNVRLAYATLIIAHMAATFIFLPPIELFNNKPLLAVDHPVHIHRVYMYREALFESGLPWGIDPGISGGAFEKPSLDVGAKPQQLMGVLLPFVHPARIVKLFLFTSVLFFPFGTMFACRYLKLSRYEKTWILFALLVPAWLYGNFVGYFYWGLAAFAFACYFLPIVIFCFDKYIYDSSLGTFLSFFIVSCLLFFLHALSTWVIAPVLAYFAIASKNIDRKWRLALLLTPIGVLVVNSFWFIPFWLAKYSPKTPWTLPKSLSLKHDMTYTSVASLLEALTLERIIAAVIGIFLAAYGLRLINRYGHFRIAYLLGISIAFSFMLKFFGSFVPIIKNFQPARFILPMFVLSVIPVGLALSMIAQRLGNLKSVALLLGSVVLLGLILATKIPVVNKYSENYDELEKFIEKNVAIEDRILIETLIQSEPKVFSLSLNREFIGSAYPRTKDPAQFARRHLWGKKLDAWKPDELERSLKQWGVQWVLVSRNRHRELITAATGSEGVDLGPYTAYRLKYPTTRFLVGSGDVISKVNRIELKNLKNESGYVAVNYRYHPGWETDKDLGICRYKITEDSAGFIAIKNAPTEITLKFNPWKMLFALWPPNNEFCLEAK